MFKKPLALTLFLLFCAINAAASEVTLVEGLDFNTLKARLENGCVEYKKMHIYQKLIRLEEKKTLTDHDYFSATDDLSAARASRDKECKIAILENMIYGMNYLHSSHGEEYFWYGRAIVNEATARLMISQLKEPLDPAERDKGIELVHRFLQMNHDEDQTAKAKPQMWAAYAYVRAIEANETPDTMNFLRSAVAIAEEGFQSADENFDISVPYALLLEELSRRLAPASTEYRHALERRINVLQKGLNDLPSTPVEVAVIHAQLGRHVIALEKLSLVDGYELCTRGLDSRLDSLKVAKPQEIGHLLAQKCDGILSAPEDDICIWLGDLRGLRLEPDWNDYFIHYSCRLRDREKSNMR